MTFNLMELPYSIDALSPYISKKTLEFHHGKHHATYVENLNNLLKNTEFINSSLEDIIAKYDANTPVFNNAAQVWNHNFFWYSMKKDGGNIPTGAIKEKIENDFTNIDIFIKNFKEIALKQFGSGWTWLILGNNNKLEIISTGNANLPLKDGKKALLTLDIWEHSYYIDYQNRRVEYINNFFDHLVNWDFANKNLLDK